MEEANQPQIGEKKGIYVPSVVEPSSIACNPLLREHRDGLPSKLLRLKHINIESWVYAREN